MIRYSVPCGAVHRGVPCGNIINRHSDSQMVCVDCEQKILGAMLRVPARWEVIFRHIGEAQTEEHIRRWEDAEKWKKKRDAAQRRAERQAAAVTSPTHVVYYAKLGENHIKIGTTGDLPTRMGALRVVNRRNLLAAEPGGFELEQQRHEQFKAWRWKKRTEDFADAPSLMTHIRQVRDEHGDPWDLAARLVADHQGRGIQSA